MVVEADAVGECMAELDVDAALREAEGGLMGGGGERTRAAGSDFDEEEEEGSPLVAMSGERAPSSVVGARDRTRGDVGPDAIWS